MTTDAKKLAAAIEAWDLSHDDGEFASLPADYVSELSGDHQNARTIIYTTKPHCLDRVIRFLDCDAPIATIGRPGFPKIDDLDLLQDEEKK